MKNILTVDLEDWFSVEVLNTVIPPDRWEEQESVVEKNTLKILDLFAERGVTATFFVLGWIADRYPDLINEVARAGHEIACHSYYHRMVSSLTPDQFKQDTDRAISAIVNACSRLPVGYRSPSWGMKRDMQWAFDILADFGFEYDSSISPIKHDIYGDPSVQQSPPLFEIPTSSGKTLIEIPASIIPVFGRVMAVGGGWTRHYPYWFTRSGITRLNRAGMPAVIYFHPWELERSLFGKGLRDLVLGRRGSVKNWVRQCWSLNTMEKNLPKLLDDFDFLPVKDYIALWKSERRKTQA